MQRAAQHRTRLDAYASTALGLAARLGAQRAHRSRDDRSHAHTCMRWPMQATRVATRSARDMACSLDAGAPNSLANMMKKRLARLRYLWGGVGVRKDPLKGRLADQSTTRAGTSDSHAASPHSSQRRIHRDRRTPMDAARREVEDGARDRCRTPKQSRIVAPRRREAAHKGIGHNLGGLPVEMPELSGRVTGSLRRFESTQ